MTATRTEIILSIFLRPGQRVTNAKSKADVPQHYLQLLAIDGL
jgi:hypothetical protein